MANNSDKMISFQDQEISYVETQQVTNGVTCDVYSFPEDSSKDLGIIYIKKNAQTPMQRIVKGDKTIEGLLVGAARLITSEGVYDLNEASAHDSIALTIGSTMQWTATEDSVLYEVCYPPFEAGRFENI